LRRRGRRQRHLVEWSRLGSEALKLDGEREAALLPLPPGLDPARPDVEIERYERAQRLRAELDGMQAARAAMGEREPLEAERRRVKEERLDILRLEVRKLTESHPYLDWGPDYERQFAVDRERLVQEIKRLEQEDLDHRRALAELGEAVEDPLRLDARISELGGEVERLSIERDAYRLAHDTLTACKDEFVRVMTQRLQSRIGRVFEAMTGGRYDEVEIDPATLELVVSGIEKRGVPSESLSRGTRDQLYFALRVAILEELAVDRALPIILDDPFLHFDRDRLARVEETLARLGHTHQILLFTHDARLAGWGFPKQFLPAPTTREEVTASEA
jgi:DNA repair exonuclease SbcCD ATPase subunit